MKVLEELINKAGYDLREITFHSDGRVIAKSGAHSRFPKKLYSARARHGSTLGTLAKEAVEKLIAENSSNT